ncbi:MAG: hypothetical protein IPP56_12910 [Bacteroidetes bacterium]|nr:hypothetical protein [Bacteroidota bacterium]MBK9671673.1 hypothetical protein [Bacteroidota bacterium]MBK9800568.1 hypothetical protein [Bacteroidota bacterium]MBP6413922.1 hypothetical protein [Bacteroidia bacterium]
MQRKKVGIVSIVIGLLMFIYGGFNYNPSEKKVNASSFNVNNEKFNNLQWPPIAGVLLVVGGIAVVLFERK